MLGLFGHMQNLHLHLYFLFFCLFQVLRENEMLRRDAEVKESKLSSSMNSIKTFWSPELKKERALRKDEVSKITVWKEQYRVIQDEAQVSHTFNIPDTNGRKCLVSNFPFLITIFFFFPFCQAEHVWLHEFIAVVLQLLYCVPLYIG